MSQSSTGPVDIEKLGAFYLGRAVHNGAVLPEPVMLPSPSLTTHAVCVGMTGSGKTGLCTALLEEAAIDGVPAIILDPKGDLTNLALTFPNLEPADFLPFVDPAEAERDGLTAEGLAERSARQWKDGLARTLQDPSRIQRMRSACDVVVYTPGSSAGRPLSILRSLHAPPPHIREDDEAFREHVAQVAGGVLALAGVPVESATAREAVLVGRILETAFADGKDLDLGALILSIQNPPFTQVGVIDLESYFPASARAELAMKLNGVLASPGFRAWTEGEPLDIQRLLYAPSGKPQLAVLSMAHLDDAARMFLVTTVLTEVLSWVRAQQGTSSLRALLFMDEVFGYLPPVANPPSKKPLLTLLKQARAFGLGVVLATQNPVDLDYKALANMGTWLLGRLQTERDKARLLDGLEGAAGAGPGREALDVLLSSLQKRQFLLHSVHQRAPTVLESRCTLSYLRGPLTRAQLKLLGSAARAPAAPVSTPSSVATTTTTTAPASSTVRGAATAVAAPALPPGLAQKFATDPVDHPLTPVLLARVKTHHTDRKSGVDVWRTLWLTGAADGAGAAWFEDARELSPDEVARWEASADQPPAGARLGAVPPAVLQKTALKAWQRGAADAAYRAFPLVLPSCPGLGLVAGPQESAGAFRVRVDQARREARDAGLQALRTRLQVRLDRVEKDVEAARAQLARQEAQAEAATLDTAVSVGAAVLGAFFGRGSALSQRNLNAAARGLGKVGRASGQHQDAAAARRRLAEAEARVDELAAELDAQTAALEQQLTQKTALATLELPPRKADTTVDNVWLWWR